MRTALILVSAAVLAACSTSGSSERGEYSVESGFGAPPPTEERTFSCPRSLSDCRSQAEEYCRDVGYTRVRTPRSLEADMAESGMARVGVGGSHRQDQIRERATIGDDVNRTMTVRCRQPRGESEE